MKIVSIYNRDNARTPVQWDSSPNAGFTTGTPWLMVNPNYREINVATQEQDENSLLSFYKQMINLRKNQDYKETLVYGDVIPFERERHNLMSYHRKGEKDLLIIGNFQKEPQTVTLPSSVKRVLLNNYPSLSKKGDTLQLSSYQAVVLELD